MRLGLIAGLLAVGLLPGCHAATPADTATVATTAPKFAALSSGKIRRTLIGSQQATGLPGWETRLYLIEYGPGAVAPLHIHPVVGVGYVLEGRFESAFGTEPPVFVETGQQFIDPAGVPHRLFRNASSDRALRFLVAYTIRTGEPIFHPGAALPSE
jgi:quercetin dioxygenase-like cupin family protein